MKIKLTLMSIVLLGTIATMSTAAMAADNWSCDKSYTETSPTITVDDSQPRIVAAISPPPPTRVRLSLDREDGSGHYEIEWDPEVSGPKVRRITPTFGTYRISLWVQPMLLNSFDGSRSKPKYINVNLSCFKSDGANGWEAKGKAFEALEDKPVALPPLTVTVKPEESAAAPRHGLIELAATQADSSLRGLADPVPDSVERVLRLIAEIAIERAKSRGFALLQRRIVKRLCKELDWTALKLADFGGKKRVLPETCALIENMRLHDIASAGRPVLKSLRGDLEGSVLPVLVKAALQKIIPNQNDLAPLVDRLIALATAVATGAPTTARDTQLLLTEISRIGWAEIEARAAGLDDIGLTNQHGSAFTCGVRLVVAIANECITRNGCSASEIADMVANSARHFAPVSGPAGACFAAGSQPMASLRQKWPTIDVVAERAVFIVRPPPNSTSTDMARAVTEIAFEIVGQLCKSNTTCDSGLVPQLRAIVDALLDRDPTMVMTRAARLIKTLEPEQKKLGQALELLSAFTAYASIEEGEDEAAAEKAREARKEAIESLIDSATDRRDRSGDWVVSLGATPGFNVVGGQRLFGSDAKTSYDRPRLQLPFGVAVQYLPDDTVGFHTMISAFELGQLIPSSAETSMDDEMMTDDTMTIRDELRWQDFVSLGVQAGVIIGRPTLPFVVGLEARWAPTLFERDVAGATEAGVFRFGVFASYYVPFFDFN